jgi:hypothetical protein
MLNVFGKSGLTNGLLLPLLFALICSSPIKADAQPAASAAKPVKVSAAVSEKLIDEGYKRNTATLHAMHLTGSASFEFTVTAEGKVTDITPIKSDKDNATVVAMARNDLSHWKFRPYLVDGKPTPMRTSTTISY